MRQKLLLLLWFKLDPIIGRMLFSCFHCRFRLCVRTGTAAAVQLGFRLILYTYVLLYVPWYLSQTDAVHAPHVAGPVPKEPPPQVL